MTVKAAICCLSLGLSCLFAVAFIWLYAENLGNWELMIQLCIPIGVVLVVLGFPKAMAQLKGKFAIPERTKDI